jgi:O-antigen/teichoic acid export membrane protein
MVSLVLARFLNPADFGLVAMLYVFIVVGNVIIEFGMTQSIIRSKRILDIELSSIFYFNILVSFGLYGIVFLFAPSIALFYKQEVISTILRIYSLSFIMTALTSVPITMMIREMRFKIQLMAMVPAVLIAGISSIYMAYEGQGVWSLLMMTLLQQFINCLLIWFFSKWYPNLVFDFSKLRPHLNFGYKLVISGVIDTAFTNIYALLLGKWFTPAIVGFYNRAEMMKQLPVANVSIALNKVTLPLFSQIDEGSDRLKNIYEKILKMVIFVISPIMFIAIAIAEPLFRFLFTEKWLPAVPYFQILCLTGILYPIHSYNLNILNIKGRSDLFLRLEVYKKILGLITILVGFRFGVYGLLWSQVAMSVVAFFINSFYSGKFISYSSLAQIKDITPYLIVSSMVGVVIYFIDSTVFFSCADFYRLLMASVIGFIIYFIIAKLLKFEVLNDFMLIIKRK